MEAVSNPDAGHAQVNDKKIYALFAAAGVAIGCIFPPVASFFVEFNPGMLWWSCSCAWWPARPWR